MKPSYFANIFPWNSVFQHVEEETTAKLIMNYLAETGDEFRPLTYKEYKIIYPNASLERFNKVINFCISADTAKCFSKAWNF